jgi:predicted molibdopterin-dependent oxidoreductase YjgC
MRILEHPILGKVENPKLIRIFLDGRPIEAIEGEPIAAALNAAGIILCRYTAKRDEPRGIFCGIGQCCDCMMTVDGVANVRTCRAVVKDGMRVETQHGWGKSLLVESGETFQKSEVGTGD